MELGIVLAVISGIALILALLNGWRSDGSIVPICLLFFISALIASIVSFAFGNGFGGIAIVVIIIFWCKQFFD